MIKEDRLTTELVVRVLNMGKTKLELANYLGITRVTLDNRLQKHKWKSLEKKAVKQLL